VNAAFLLVTGAMLVGQGDKKPATPTPPPPAPAAAASCCSSDPCGCESWGHRLRDRLSGHFNRNNCDSCQPSCCDQKPAHTSCGNSCNNSCGTTRLWHRNSCDTCAPAPTCTDACGGHGGFNFLGRLRDRFGRNDCCCDGGCGSTAAPAPKSSGEPIAPPKKMPVETPKKTTTEVRINTPPVSTVTTPNTIQPLRTAPAVEITPVPVPRVDGDRRDPF
jgi:hypothetical protein